MLERLAGFQHERFYLSRGRTARSAITSLPARWPRLAARMRSAQLIHAHGDVAAVLALPLMRGRPAVITTHGLHMLRRAVGFRGTLMERAVAATAARCRAVICTSAVERDELAGVIHEPDRGKLRVIHNGVDAPPALDPSVRASIRERLGAGAGTVLGLFIGQLEARKAPLLAARAATRAHAQAPSFTLAVAGDGPQKVELDGLRGDAVSVLGYRTDVETLLGAADVFVQPSEREGMSLALLQAMASGLAVVAADGPGNPEAVGDTGVLFAAGDEDALVSALTALSADAGRRSSLGRAARARAAEQFSAARFLAATEAVYREALTAVTVPRLGAGGSRA
jgi:glycosyltransferase involved in cell wall biosynthesis